MVLKAQAYRQVWSHQVPCGLVVNLLYCFKREVLHNFDYVRYLRSECFGDIFVLTHMFVAEQWWYNARNQKCSVL